MFRQNKTHLPHKFIFPCLLIMLTILFPACSASSRANPTAESGSAYPAITSAEEGRNLIAERTNGRTIDSLGSEDLAFLRFCYDEIKTMEDFTEADYQAVERICSAQGDRRAQWEILYEAYCLYPTPDKAASLSDLAMPITTQESPLLARFNEQFFADEKISMETYVLLNEYMDSPEWSSIFLLENGAMGKRTYGWQGNSLLQVSQSASQRDLLYKTGDAFLLQQQSPAGGLCLSGILSENHEMENAFSLYRYDAEGECYLALTGVLADGHLIDDFTVAYDGITYTGTLDAQGHVITAQKVWEKNLIYAHEESGNRYLYAEGVDSASFVVTADFWNLPDVIIWPETQTDKSR